MRDDGTWISEALKAFAEIANSDKGLAMEWLHESVVRIPAIHTLWTVNCPCGQAVPESRPKSLAAGMRSRLKLCPLIYPQPANKVSA